MQNMVHGTVGPSTGLRTGILGFGVDGQSVGEWLSTQEDVESILVFDDNEEDVRQKMKDISNSSVLCLISYVSPEEKNALQEIDVLFRSPGFPLTHPLIKEAKEKGIAITSSTTEVLKNFSGVTIGITGSNGKTTCVALIEEFLKAEFPPSLKLRGAGGADQVERGGNDGVPRLDLLGLRTKDVGLGADISQVPSPKSQVQFLVLELSSFQLIDCPVSPNVSIVLNLSPNHLDWHSDMEEYAEAKRQIVAHQNKGDIAVLNQNDLSIKSFAEDIESDVHWFTEDVPEDVLCVTHPETIKAAVTAARALKVSEANIINVLREFPGVPHRLEFIRELDGVKWYNDSSCTTPESVITACEAFPEEKLIILMGGRDKGMDFSGLYEVIKTRKVRVVPYGEMAEEIASHIPTELLLQNSEFCILNSEFSKVIETAKQKSKTGDSVVLSPACASFDMFKNAKERGAKFSEIVKSL
jgi:UDP-N-acetylmuramoylalanine--D-glutamate ligase